MFTECVKCGKVTEHHRLGWCLPCGVIAREKVVQEIDARAKEKRARQAIAAVVYAENNERKAKARLQHLERVRGPMYRAMKRKEADDLLEDIDNAITEANFARLTTQR